MNKEVNSMLFTDINGKWERIYTSEQVIETLQKDKEKLQTRIDKAIEYINIQCEDELLESDPGAEEEEIY